MKYLITGGAGFIGSHLTDRLLECGHHVFCLDNFDDYYPPAEKRKNIRAHLLKDNYQLIEGTVTDAVFMEESLARIQPEIVIHLAAKTGVRKSFEIPRAYFETNVTGTILLWEAIKKHPVKKVIYASSSSVYGINQKLPFAESDEIRQQVSPYAASKLSGESLCHVYQNRLKIPTMILRFFTVFGTRQRPDLAIRQFIEKVLQKEEIVLFGDGSMSRDYTHISDIVDGITAAVAYNTSPYEIFNLGNSNPTNLIRLIEIIETCTGEKAIIKFADVPDGDVPVTYADVSKAKNLLGYSPKKNLEEGITEMVHWLGKDLR